MTAPRAATASRTLTASIAILFALAAFALRADTVAQLQARLSRSDGLERARVLSQLTDATRNDNPRAAIAYGDEALKLLASSPDTKVEVATCNELGWAHMMVSEYPQAIAMIERAKQLAEKTGNEQGLARAINNLGVVSQKQGDPLRAVELFTESMNIQERVGNRLEVANELNNLGFIYSTDLADYDRALEYHLKALRTREKLGDDEAIALSLNNIGIVYSRLNDNAKAIDYFEKALAIRRTIGDPSSIAQSLVNVGVVYTAMGKLALAEKYLSEALGYKVKDKGLIVRNHLALAEIYRARGAYGDALVQARLALSTARAMSSTELVRRSLEESASIHESAGDYREALADYKTFKETSDEIFSEERAKRIGMLESRYATEKREREIERLKREEALRELAVSRKTLQRNTVAAAALLLGLIGFAAYRRHVEKARLAEELSMTDSLTGLKNRRYLGQTMELDAALCRRRHRAQAADTGGLQEADMVILLMDIDDFKSVNDRYGHEAGDQVLQKVAGLLQRIGRSSDLRIRWGGEEFLIVSRFTHRSQGITLAERIRSAFEETQFDIGNGTSLRLTCSIGVAPYPFSKRDPEALTWQQVLIIADHATYQAKRSGRNAWVSVSLKNDMIPAGFDPAECESERWRNDLVIESSSGEIVFAKDEKAVRIVATAPGCPC